MAILDRDKRETWKEIGAVPKRAGWTQIAATVACATAVTGVLAPGSALADPDQPPALPGFTPAPTDWSPHMDIWPYSTFTYQVTPEMIGGMSDSCQWFNAQFDPLMGQINAFNRNGPAQEIINTTNWIVCGQSPKAGTTVKVNPKKKRVVSLSLRRPETKC